MYQLDPEAAKQADQKGGSINESGKYTGMFTRAENVTSTKKTQGVEFSFKSDDGRSADYLTLWTKNRDGNELYGYKVLMAIMACLKVKSLSVKTQMVEKYNFDTKEREQVQAEVFPELMNKPIGLLIQMEEYEKQNGTTNWKPAIFAPFVATEEFTASEVLNRSKQPEALEKMLAVLRDRPLRGKPSVAPAAQSAPGSFDDFDDDLPF